MYPDIIILTNLRTDGKGELGEEVGGYIISYTRRSYLR